MGYIFLVLSIFASASADSLSKNKDLVRSLYEGVFVHHKVKETAEKYLADNYIQHNPNVATGRQPFIDFFVPFFEKNPDARSAIKRIIAEGNFVMVHVHSQLNKGDRGRAVMDIFRIDGEKVAEHWDVAQPIPEKAANSNTMF